ncbi:hypothetical protein [Asticcacaulis sp. YBE204]|uniref:hypothetical protein n=1 Tax=Asticcacaulis sp. YBE204 TaxID=1282363 RepID=UPI0003C3CD34|nr:hypothetical protein [Asticcacaulis sp. YBE204]ESQ78671.1 hypothetical protein AEYBE204_11850 [Asticcacaulis sp. YBE204]
MAISNQELQKIRHLDVENINGRVIATLMFYIEDSWEWWVETEIGLMKLQGWPAESGYFGNKAEKQTDMSFLFLDFLVQRASIPSISTYITGITDDIFNLSASLKKVAFLHHKRDEIGYGLSRMIIGEIEYLISTCRAIYDLLQELIAKVWHTIKLHDETAPKKKQLVDRFFKMVAKGTPAIPLSVNEIAETYKIPAQLAEFYVRQSSYFLALRDFRDRIIHSGKSVDTVFVADDDFLVREAFVPL